MLGDLHCHSTFSDGSVPIAKLPPMAARLGLSHLAVSDHDSILSVRYAYQNPILDGVQLIPATELSAYDFERNHRAHLLCFWPDDCEALHQQCSRMQQRRNNACLQSAKELEHIYPQFCTEMALEYAKDSGTLYKSGIMQALCELGLADGIYGERYLQLFHSKTGKVFHAPGYDTVADVLQIARDCRAVIIFAHPSVYKSMPLVRQLAAEGLIDGIEVEHPRNTEEDKEECRELCRKYGLIATGGTDFHGSNTKHPRPLASCTTTEEQLLQLQALAMQRKKG